MSSRDRGVLVVTVDVPLAADTAASEQRVLETVDWLRNLLDRLQLPSTWGFSDARLPTAGPFASGASGLHELAVMGDRTWLGREAGRKRFARGLGERVAAARTAGAPATTLFAGHAICRDHIDLLIKRGFSAVRGALDPDPVVRAGPAPACYGLWLFPTSPPLPRGNDRFTMWAWSIWQNWCLVRLADRGGYAQWALDIGRLVSADVAARDAVERVLTAAERLRSRDRLRVHNMTGWVERHRAVRLYPPSQSILRRAA